MNKTFVHQQFLTKMSTPVKVCHCFWRFTTVDFFISNSK